ncbi:MAG: helix-turn-helix domain-containing protein [Neglectibacter sp.]
MKICMSRLELLLASMCKTTADLRPGVSPQTIRNIKAGKDVRPDVVGRVARALGVDVADILEEEAN